MLFKMTLQCDLSLYLPCFCDRLEVEDPAFGLVLWCAYVVVLLFKDFK